MLFLTMGEMRHEPLWSLWFQQAAGTAPVDCLAPVACGENAAAGLQQVADACLSMRTGQAAFQHWLVPRSGQS